MWYADLRARAAFSACCRNPFEDVEVMRETLRRGETFAKRRDTKPASAGTGCEPAKQDERDPPAALI